MRQLGSGGATYQFKKHDLYPRPVWGRLAIVLGLTILYAASFVLLINVGPIGAALVAIPVAVAGWYFGMRAGLIASVLGAALSGLLLAGFGGRDSLAWAAMALPGILTAVIAGYLGGRLHDELAERTRILDELQSRDRYLTLVTMTLRDILTPKNIDDRYDYLITHLVNLFVADYAFLVRWDAVQEQATPIASTMPLEKPVASLSLGRAELEMTAAALRAGHVQFLEDLPEPRAEIHPTLFGYLAHSPRSVLCIPLITKKQKWGAAIIAYAAPHHFSAKEMNEAEFAADHFALALWTIQQESEIQKQIKVANTLANIERALGETEKIGIQTVLQLIADSAMELIPGTRNAVLHLLESDRQILVPRAVAGPPGEFRAQLNMHPGEGVAGEVVATGRVVAISDTATEPRFLNLARPVDFRSLIVAPIQRNERCVGTISIQSDQPNAFLPDDSQLLDALGIEAAIAIENATLLEATRQDLREINALYHISRQLAASLDPDRLMQDMVDLLKQDFGYYHVQIYVVDPESGDLLARRGSGEIGDRLFERGYRLPAGAGIVGHVAETEQPFITNDVDQVVFFVRNTIFPETQSELTVPIKIEEEVVGVLDILQVLPGRLTQRDMRLMTTVADQLAVALQQARLYTELQTSLTQEKAVRSQLIQSERLAVVGRLLASVSHELNNPLQAIQNALFLLKDEQTLSSQGRQDLDIVLSETERMSILLERLQTVYRPTRTEDFQDIELNHIVESVIALTTTHMRHNKINLEFFPDPDLPPVPAISDQIRQVVLNLFVNAVEAMQSGGKLSIQTRSVPEEGLILLSISDTGPGIDPRVLPRIFEPFITNKETGTGLGLAISQDIIRQHGGIISAENNPKGGATFKVWLPVRRKN
ncbi:MAG TPA: GAF domain-containing protein [Anaerolineales bacterium]|nr:GAF domain-containing protein [Anaerolineales bacterium]